MLTVLTALIPGNPQREGEAIDRDPGIVALLATMIGSARRGIGSTLAALPASDQRANEAEVSGATNAWPYDRRTH